MKARSLQRKTNGKRFNALAQHQATNHSDNAITFINNNDFGWKANTCMLSQDHAQYGSHCNQEGGSVTLAQVDNNTKAAEAPKVPVPKKFGENTKEFQAALAKA